MKLFTAHQVFSFMEHESCSDEKSTVIVKWGKWGITCIKFWNTTDCLHCSWKHSVAVLSTLSIFFFLNHSFPLLLKEVCSTNKLVKKNNLSEKSDPKNSSMLPCQRNLAIMRNQSHSQDRVKVLQVPVLLQAFCVISQWPLFSFRQTRKHGRPPYVS